MVPAEIAETSSGDRRIHQIQVCDDDIGREKSASPSLSAYATPAISGLILASNGLRRQPAFSMNFSVPPALAVRHTFAASAGAARKTLASNRISAPVGPSPLAVDAKAIG
jgi:hypothetical protein